MDESPDDAAKELALLQAFRNGMIKRHFGLYIDSESITDQGLDETVAAANGLRAMRPDGIRALEPLLDDPDPGVRSGAADFLSHIMPEKALPVLIALGKSAEPEASMTARVALRFYRQEKSLN